MNKPWLAILMVTAVLGGALVIQPDASPVHDATVFLDIMRQFLEQGLRAPVFREPGFPLFLVLLNKTGLPLLRSIAFVQNLMFLATLYVFLRAAFGSCETRSQSLVLAAGITAIPTFWIVVNGAIYAEALLTSLLFLMLAAAIKLYAAMGRLQHGTKACRWVVCWFGVILVCSVALSLIKGSFIYINMAWPLVTLAAFMIFPGAWLRGRRLVLFVGLLAICAGAGRVAVSLWLGLREGQPVFSARVFDRGGAILYGRAEYARRFDFCRDSAPYLLNSLSETACRAVYGDCLKYTWQGEDDIGFALEGREQGGLTNEQLFEEGQRGMLNSPIRQLIFVFFELSRFILHHTTTGFAVLNLPVLGPIVHSKAMVVLLKAFNLFLYLFIPVLLLRNRHRLKAYSVAMTELSEAAKVGLTLGLAYVLAFLAVHGFAVTVVRMCYPVAPLLVLANVVAWRLHRRASMPSDA